MNYFLDVLRNKYAQFDGRARRQEYWMFALYGFLGSVAIWLIELVLNTNMINFIYSLAIFIPGIAVGVRRLHDTNRSGWWLLLALLPVIGTIVVLIFMVTDSTPGANQYGPNPKEVTPSTPFAPSGPTV